MKYQSLCASSTSIGWTLCWRGLKPRGPRASASAIRRWRAASSTAAVYGIRRRRSSRSSGPGVKHCHAAESVEAGDGEQDPIDGPHRVGDGAAPPGRGFVAVVRNDEADQAAEEVEGLL